MFYITYGLVIIQLVLSLLPDHVRDKEAVYTANIAEKVPILVQNDLYTENQKPQVEGLERRVSSGGQVVG